MKEQITRLTCDRCGGVDVPGTQECREDRDGKRWRFELCPTCLAMEYTLLISRLPTDLIQGSMSYWREELR